IQVDIELSFKDSIFGTERTINLNKTSACEHCKGNGAEPGTDLRTCATCSGKGQLNETRRSILGSFSTTRICDECHGTGKVPKQKCRECHGYGVQKKQKTLTFTLPPGIETGQMVRLTGQGEAVMGGDPGDLYVKVHVKQDKRFVKQNLNLRTSLDVKLSDALLGAEVGIDTLDGLLQVTIPAGVTFGETLRIKGKGVPYPGNKMGATHNTGQRGDLLIDLNIILPKKLSKAAKKTIEDLRSEGV
ncbi:MAG: DnaJ C-terminal domain-containing protein, partial [Candidatus Pacebacteria bacterium]|nr:DnaJ C-terminal domain-containing protein [Candidatus Paceibacterota bacterium]